MKLFENIASQNNVQIRSIYGGKVAPKDNILYDVSNKRRIGITESQMIIDMYNSVKGMLSINSKFRKLSLQVVIDILLIVFGFISNDRKREGTRENL